MASLHLGQVQLRLYIQRLFSRIPAQPQGTGPSLVPYVPDVNKDWNNGWNWRASFNAGGSPYADDHNSDASATCASLLPTLLVSHALPARRLHRRLLRPRRRPSCRLSSISASPRSTTIRLQTKSTALTSVQATLSSWSCRTLAALPCPSQVLH